MRLLMIWLRPLNARSRLFGSNNITTTYDSEETGTALNKSKLNEEVVEIEQWHNLISRNTEASVERKTKFRGKPSAGMV